MIEYYYKKKKEDKVEKIESFKDGCWVNVTNPNNEEIKYLVEKFKLSEANLLDGLDIHENPRFEIEEKNHIFILLAQQIK